MAAVGLTVTWILLQFGGILGPVRNALLPSAIAVTVGAVFRILMPLDQKLSDLLKRDEVSSITEAVPHIGDIVAHDREATEIKILASTGGTSITNLVPPILRKSKARSIRITLHVIDPDGASSRWFPEHWGDEARSVIRRIMGKEWPQNVTWIIRSYEYVPVVGGMLINSSHLFLGFYRWRDSSGTVELSGTDTPHHYYRQGQHDFDFFFDVFHQWFDESPTTLIWDSRVQSP